MIGPRDVTFTAIAMSRSSGESATSATKAIEKLTVRLSRSDVRIARRRLSAGRLTDSAGVAAMGSSKTGYEPVTIELGSAPREAIRNCPEERGRQPDDRNDLSQSALRLGTDLDRVPVTKRQLIEREPLVEG